MKPAWLGPRAGPLRDDERLQRGANTPLRNPAPGQGAINQPHLALQCLSLPCGGQDRAASWSVGRGRTEQGFGTFWGVAMALAGGEELAPPCHVPSVSLQAGSAAAATPRLQTGPGQWPCHRRMGLPARGGARSGNHPCSHVSVGQGSFNVQKHISDQNPNLMVEKHLFQPVFTKRGKSQRKCLEIEVLSTDSTDSRCRGVGKQETPCLGKSGKKRAFHPVNFLLQLRMSTNVGREAPSSRHPVWETLASEQQLRRSPSLRAGGFTPSRHTSDGRGCFWVTIHHPESGNLPRFPHFSGLLFSVAEQLHPSGRRSYERWFFNSPQRSDAPLGAGGWAASPRGASGARWALPRPVRTGTG